MRVGRSFLLRCPAWRMLTCAGPVSSVIMLNEMEEVLELVEAEQIAKVGHLLFSILAKCVCCSHFQVAERALFLWNNEHLINVRPLWHGPRLAPCFSHATPAAFLRCTSTAA